MDYVISKTPGVRIDGHQQASFADSFSLTATGSSPRGIYTLGSSTHLEFAKDLNIRVYGNNRGAALDFTYSGVLDDAVSNQAYIAGNYDA